MVSPGPINTSLASAIRRRDCPDCLHDPNGTHREPAGDRERFSLPGLGPFLVCDGGDDRRKRRDVYPLIKQALMLELIDLVAYRLVSANPRLNLVRRDGQHQENRKETNSGASRSPG